MVAYPEKSYVREWEDAFVHVRTIEEMLRQIKRLKDDKRYYNLIAQRALAVSEDYHISEIAKRYLNLKYKVPDNQ